MSAFDRLEGYSARKTNKGVSDTVTVFDKKTPRGAFLSRVHDEGYKMYNIIYTLPLEISSEMYSTLPDEIKSCYCADDSNKYITNNVDNFSEDKLSNCSDEFKSLCNQKVEYTEAYNVITTEGNQLVNAIAGSGKCELNGTGVLTPVGFVPIETLKVGDLVYAEDGLSYPVLGVYPRGKKLAYEVKFSDGNKIICGDDHLWNVQTDSQRTMMLRGDKDKGQFWTTLSTKELLNFPLRTKSGKNNCYIPMQKAVIFDSCDKLTMNPYLLGLLLGNGTLSGDTVSFSSADESVLNAISDILSHEYDNLELHYSSNYDYRISNIKTGRNADGSYIKSEISEQLKKLNLRSCISDTKFIPKEYLYSSVDNRLELLAGLLDTDGYWANSYYEYTTVSKQLADDITFLVESLGMTVAVYTKQGFYKDSDGVDVVCKLAYRLNIKPSSDFPKLHKCDRLNSQWRETRGFCHRRITEVSVLDYEADMTCIEVGSPSHLYLTEHFIPTHNTTTLIFKIMYDLVTGVSKKVIQAPTGMQVAVPDSIFVGTFLRSGAKELEERLDYWQNRLGYTSTKGQIQFSTLDAEFKRCLNAMNIPTPIGKEEVLSKLRKKAIDSCGITRDGNPLTNEDYQIINSVIVYYRGRLDDKKYQHPNAREYGLTPSILDLVVKQYASLRQIEGVMDFEEIQELLYQYLYVTPNKAVQDFVANRFKFMYVDEFQDTSQMQYAILKYYARGHQKQNILGVCKEEVSYTGEETKGKFVVIGDPSQCFTADTNFTVQCRNSFLDGSEQVDPNNDFSVDHKYFEKDYKEWKSNGSNKVFWADSGWFETAEDIEEGMLLTGFSDDVNNGYTMVTGVKRHKYSGCVVSFIGYNNERKISVTPEHEFFEYVGDCITNIKKPYVIFFYDKDDDNFREVHQLVDNWGTHYFGTCEQVFSYIDGAKLESVEFYYNFDDNYYKTIRAIDIRKDTILAIRSGSDGAVYNSVVDAHYKIIIEDYDGFVYDINTSDHIILPNSSLVSHNCIYSFKGSDKEIICSTFDEDFMPTHTALSYNYRCPSNILNPIVPSIHINPEGSKQSINAYNEGGIFHAYNFSSMQNMIKKLQEDLDEDMSNGMKSAILCRTNFDGLIPAFVLESRKIYNFSISGKNMTLNSPLPRKLIGVTSLFTERATPSVRTTLEMFVPRFDHWKVKQLVDTMKNNNMNIWQVPIEDIDYSIPNLVDMIESLKGIMMPDGQVRDKEKELEALKFIYFWLTVNTFSGDNSYCMSARAYIDCLLYILDTNEFKSVYEFLEELDEIDDRLNGRIDKKKVDIEIATVHEFKGKERDSVYVWNDSENVFPSSKCDLVIVDQVEEERRVHYIACTRAKKKSSIYSLIGKEGMFANEMDAKFINPIPPKATFKKNI